MFDTRRRAFFFLLFSIALGLAAVIIFSSYMDEQETNLGELVTIQIASKEIPAGVLITSDMLGTSEIPRKYLSSSYVQTVKELDGKISMVPIPKGGVITQPMLRSNNLISGEYRQVILRTPLTVFDDRIDVLDQVDLVASYENKDEESGGGDDSRTTKVLLRDVSVNSVSKRDDEIIAIGVALPIDMATEVIWMLNYGKELRVLKSGNAKVGTEGES